MIIECISHFLYNTLHFLLGCDVTKLFCNSLLHVCPNMLDQVEVRGISGVYKRYHF